jgi:serine/threonine-protein kinase
LARRLPEGPGKPGAAAEAALPAAGGDPPPAGQEPGTQGVLGTPGYLAPEQARGEADLTPAVDVWGLGAVLYQLLTGRTPYTGSRDERLAQAADPGRLVPPPSAYNPNVGAGSDLELVCLRCLAKEPGGRYPSAAALADDLERVAGGEPSPLRREGWLESGLRHAVGAVNHKLALPGIGRWGSIDCWDAGLNLAENGALFALIRADVAPAWLWAAHLTFVAGWWWVFLTYLYRQDPVAPVERHLALLWAGVTLAGVTLFALACPPWGDHRAADLLAYYPPWTVVNGLGFLVVGRLYWGRYYLVGLAHFLVALLLPWCLGRAPLVYGVFVAVCMVASALDHRRDARQAQPPS